MPPLPKAQVASTNGNLVAPPNSGQEAARALEKDLDELDDELSGLEEMLSGSQSETPKAEYEDEPVFKLPEQVVKAGQEVREVAHSWAPQLQQQSVSKKNAMALVAQLGTVLGKYGDQALLAGARFALKDLENAVASGKGPVDRNTLADSLNLILQKVQDE